MEIEAYGDFRDESREVARKHANKLKHPVDISTQDESLLLDKKSPQLSLEAPPTASSSNLALLNDPLFSVLPPCSFEEGAASFFFNECILDGDTPSHPIYSRLPAMYNSQPPTSPLYQIITALGLSSLSLATKSPQVMIKANARYAEALISINTSLRDPVLAKDDQTLIVVMLLGMYEEVCIHFSLGRNHSLTVPVQFYHQVNRTLDTPRQRISCID